MTAFGLSLNLKLRPGWAYDWFVALPAGAKIAIIFGLAMFIATAVTIYSED